LGDLKFDARGEGVRLAAPPQSSSPAYRAGLDRGDEIKDLDGHRVSSAEEVQAVLARRRPGDSVTITFVNRTGLPQTRTVTLANDPALDIVPAESPTAAQKQFRQRWLGSFQV
jgi:predicted metalloprotease with PDZ domain